MRTLKLIVALSFAVLMSNPLQASEKTKQLPVNSKFKLFHSREKTKKVANSKRKSAAADVVVSPRPTAQYSTPKRSRPAESVANIGRSIRNMFVRTTAYTHTESDHLKYGNKNAIGTILQCRKDYNSAAADWSRFPLGTKFLIAGDSTVYVVDDCGGALWGTSTIDIYRPSMAAMHAWGTRHVEIKILEYGK